MAVVTLGAYSARVREALEPGRACVAVLAVLALAAFAVAMSGRSGPRATVGARRSAIEVWPRTPDEVRWVTSLADDVWTEHVADAMTIVVGPAQIRALTRDAVPHRVVVDDVDAVAALEHLRLAHRPRAGAGDWFSDYRDLREIDAYLAGLAGRHRDAAAVRTLGTSIEGHPIRAIEISRGGPRWIAIDGGQHAREWISVMVPVCIADRLLAGGSQAARVRAILDAVSFTIVPVVNPDGYDYTWTTDRYWRKNRRGHYGVDLNRNYDVGWGGAGSSDDRRSPNYRGEAPFSEPETAALRALFASRPIAGHVDFHSYSQVIVYPWSYQRTEPADADAFATIADRMHDSIRAARGRSYAIRPGSSLRVGAGGTLGDWAYATHQTLSFLVELRPSSSAEGGFVLPPEEIVPTCDEALAAVLAVAEGLIDRDALHPESSRRGAR